MSLNATKASGNDYLLTRELLVLFVLWKKNRKINRDVLLVGLCDSGKTALFSYLLYNKPIQSFTSQVENVGTYQSRKNLLRLVDIPGHERVFTKYWDVYKASCKGVMFVIESDTVQANICDVAELLYRVLTDATIQANNSKIIILCNKQDKLMAKGFEVIKTLLEKKTRHAEVEKVESVGKHRRPKKQDHIGQKKKHFEFSHCQIPVEFTEVISAAQDVVIEPIKNWLKKIQ